MFWVVGEWSLIVLVGVFILTQMVWPAFTDRPLFWIFRRRGRELAKVEESFKATELALDVEKMRQRLLQLEAELKEAQRKEQEAGKGDAIS